MSNLAANVEAVNRRLEAAARRAGRDPAGVTLVAVTKTQPLEVVIEAYGAGLCHFGENRAAEGRAKAAGLAEWLSQRGLATDPPAWHLIGHLQSRQVADALACYRMIHSVDSLKLAERINRLADSTIQPPVEVLLQCNVSGEATKSGFALERWPDDPAQAADFAGAIAGIAALPGLVIRGLMTIAPLVDDPEDARPVFRRLAALRDWLRAEFPQLDWQHLSMGMTDDFEVAIEEGATLVRVGRALFGERNYP